MGARVELDTERRVLRLTSPSPLAAPGFRTLGLRLGPAIEPSATRPVVDVIPGTPAVDMGIAVGDSILSIEGVPAPDLTPRSLRVLAAAHDAVDVVLRRADRVETVRLYVAVLP